jgi:peptide/nickel transport system ATP-binding protein
MTEEHVLEVTDLRVAFPTDEGLVQAVRGVSYQLRRGEVLGIVGESGSGKSVTSLAAMGLLPPTAQVSGSVRLGGRSGVELIGASDAELSRVRGRQLSMIFQDPMTSLNPVYTVGYQIAEAIRAHHDLSRGAALRQAVQLLDLVSIPNPAERVRSYPHELSGGMRQRVVIAIAIANRPEVIIADEPTTALDVTVQAQVLEALHTAKAETGAAMLLITHDLGVIAGQADRVLVMYAGRIVESGTVDEIFYTPRMPYTLGLLGSLPRIDVPTDRLSPISGASPSVINMPPGCPFTPRCPLAAPLCEAEEPALEPATGAGHRSACHFRERLDGLAPGDLFHPVSRDADLPGPAARPGLAGQREEAR